MINSIDCATALSSSISKTRMPVPHSRRSGRQVGRELAALKTPLNN
jgi:hypothetical protein